MTTDHGTTRFTHVVNPFPARPGTEHGIAQSVTFASLERAVDHARAAGIAVEVLSAVVAGDDDAAQPPSRVPAHLKRTICDVAPILPKRPLPLIRDILEIGHDHGTGDYLIYTNVDIAVQPRFYEEVARFVRDRETTGPAAFCINRRTISDAFTGPDELDEMYRDRGEPHPGFDCFVFPRKWVPLIDLGSSSIGAMWFAGLLLANLDRLSDWRLDILKDEHLTFHLGNEKNWVGLIAYEKHNLREAGLAMERLSSGTKAPETSFFRAYQGRVRRANGPLRRLLMETKRFKGMVMAVRWAREQLGRT